MIQRRGFLRSAALAAGGVVLGGSDPAGASAGGGPSPGAMGMLVDTTWCIGCRRCEMMCNRRHGLPAPRRPFSDLSVTREARRPTVSEYTVVNTRTGLLADKNKPIHTKVQCFHCVDPACVSACIVGALRKRRNGAVTYGPGDCIGCRYCLAACPFEIPAYEYHKALAPRVMKCTFCHEWTRKGEGPACMTGCPRGVLTFAERGRLIEHARGLIRRKPKRYHNHLYGEHEMGGTSWLYLAAVPPERLGLLELGSSAPPRLTEAIQHGVFKLGLPPLLLAGFLGLSMWHLDRRRAGSAMGDEPDGGSAGVREAAAVGDGERGDEGPGEGEAR